MSIFGGGSNLPPGCRVSDIPGNRPEDEAWETIYNNFWDKERLTKKHIGITITDSEYDVMERLFNPKTTDPQMLRAAEVIDNYIMAAIEYGMEVGTRETMEADKENKFYESLYRQEVRIPKLRAYFKKLRAIANDNKRLSEP